MRDNRLLVLALATLLLLPGCGGTSGVSEEAASARPPGDNMNYRTRKFVGTMRACRKVVLLSVGIAGKSDDLTAAQAIYKAKDTCDSIRTILGGMDKSHFYDQADTGILAVDDYKDGLGEMLNYLDTGAPSALAAAQDHLSRARDEQVESIETINARRAVYGLPPLRILLG